MASAASRARIEPRHAEPERLGRREAEGPVDPARPGRDERLDRRLDRGWDSGEDRRAEVTDPGQVAEVEGAARRSPARTRRRPAAARLRRSSAGRGCSWNDVAKIVPTIASATVPPIWRKNVRFDVATPSCWNGTAFWTTIVEAPRTSADAQAGEEHPQPDDRHGCVLGQLGHQREATPTSTMAPNRRSATCSVPSATRSGRTRSSCR